MIKVLPKYKGLVIHYEAHCLKDVVLECLRHKPGGWRYEKLGKLSGLNLEEAYEIIKDLEHTFISVEDFVEDGSTDIAKVSSPDGYTERPTREIPKGCSD